MLLTERGLVLFATKRKVSGKMILLSTFWERFTQLGNGLINRMASNLCRKITKILHQSFTTIYLERPKGDRDGYDLVVVDAMHEANYASRICHSCLPNCEAK